MLLFLGGYRDHRMNISVNEKFSHSHPYTMNLVVDNILINSVVTLAASSDVIWAYLKMGGCSAGWTQQVIIGTGKE